MTIGAVSVAMLAVVFAFVYKTQKNSGRIAEKNAQASFTPYIPDQNTLTERDSDEDGLKDCEEVLWKTNPNEKDSDGDGTNDHQETLSGRDPTIPGPNDKLKSAETATRTATTSENLTATERLGREFFAQYIAAQQAGIPITEDSMQESMQTLVANTASLLKTKKYTTADIRIVSDTDKNTLKQYGNALGEIALRYTPKNAPGGDEITILNGAVSTKNYAELQKLDPRVETVAKTLSGAIALPVPQNIASLHIHLLNAMSDYKEMLGGMRAAENDPVRAFIAVGNYQKDLVALAGALRDIGRYFKTQGVDFGTKESGHVFVKSL